MKTEKRISKVQWSRIMAYAWEHPEFKEQLERNPLEAINNHTLFVDYGITHVITIPEKPDVDDQIIEDIADGKRSALAIPYTCCC